MKPLVEVAFHSYAESVAKAFDQAGAKDLLAKQTAILVKPNLINDSPFPITTPALQANTLTLTLSQRERERGSAQLLPLPWGEVGPPRRTG